MDLNVYQLESGVFYRAYVPKPDDVVQRQNGNYYRVIRTVSTDAEGFINETSTDILVCEDCWKPVPNYVDFGRGLVSPESDDPAGNFTKQRFIQFDGHEGWEALQKVVCLPCYRLAFQRVYPKRRLPDLRDDFRQVVLPPPPVLPSIFVEEPRL